MLNLLVLCLPCVFKIPNGFVSFFAIFGFVPPSLLQDKRVERYALGGKSDIYRPKGRYSRGRITLLHCPSYRSDFSTEAALAAFRVASLALDIKSYVTVPIASSLYLLLAVP